MGVVMPGIELPRAELPRAERMVENLNAALHSLFAAHDDTYLIGEDLLDPYGGAFKAAKGLSTKYPERVLTTPLSENGFLGVANGLALCGNKVIVEIMFGDFVLLAFDQLCNFGAKSVSMYGSTVPMQLVVRCPVGGHRGYGPTHSQSVQKHFLGIPNLSLFEMTPLHDNAAVFDRMLATREPCVLFEDKTLYGQRRWTDERDDMFEFDFLGEHDDYGRARPKGVTADPDCLVIATGGTAPLALAAARTLVVESEIMCHLLVPSRLYPLDIDAIARHIAAAGRVVVVEEGVAGGTWGADVAQRIYERHWGALRDRVHLVHSAPSIIPSAAHLERDVLVRAESVVSAVQALCPS
jgi:pyruvate/2-oxoglutarate/acetoin dehydrogenase E1 component